ncbi:MAG: bifunctional diaminohydroxyphosphoribosylaminopyrimidine deaminase/5-amino-6-(5-phosphoribosylamino)uracil reductase RibD [Gammaproteobacteria bacterium]|nr:bifunctional diaminohydroxyphosphoribosylaminopyrimidine deaminase/5-amino-6-(5-phosphoribosylamino)uracil reductase RibD [Gammaproteobacteria bacterium]
MQRAIELASRGSQTTTPNPNVGCVLVKDGTIIGEGFHQRAGDTHAEINALQHAKSNGHDVTGTTAYVTLEPCSHFGKTPPCADALIKAKIAEVFIGSRDPNPEVCGRGVEKLRDAGILVTEDILRNECDELNLGFFKRMTTGMPWVSAKLGMSLDAKIATASGESKWITGEQSRADVQYLRSKSCAILTSSATVTADNPSLNVRLENTSRQPKRAIIDSNSIVPCDANIFNATGDVLVYNSVDNLKNQTHSFKENTQFINIERKSNHVNLSKALYNLGSTQECNTVFVEAGGRFVGALLAENLIDELIIYTAPIIIGDGARPAFSFAATKALQDAHRFTCISSERIGNDIKTIYRKQHQ